MMQNSGRNFAVEGRKFDFFGKRCLKTEDGKWLISITDGVDAWVEVDRRSVSSQIEGYIREDRKAGREGLIDHVLISPASARGLALEGKITAGVLAKAEETEDTITITLDFEGKPRKVVINKNLAPNYIATIDATGNVV